MVRPTYYFERVTWADKWRAIIVERMTLRSWNLKPASRRPPAHDRRYPCQKPRAINEALELLPGTPVGVATTPVGEYATITDHEPKVEGRGSRYATIVVSASVNMATTMALVSGRTMVEPVSVSVDEGEIAIT
jgi:hypothetical protein